MMSGMGMARSAAEIAAEERRVAHLNVNEMFGPTIQGEGRHAGALCSFLRLAGCNLTCSWCDTPYTWDWTRFDHSAESHRLEVPAVIEEMSSLAGRLVVSGGEPLLQSSALAEVLTAMPGRFFDLETNGTRPLGATEGLWSTVTCSPKIIPSAKQDRVITAAIHPQVEAVADFKFVISDDADLRAVLGWLAERPAISTERVWLMPEGVTTEALTARTPLVMDAATNHGFNFCTRLHVYGWHDLRGH